MKIALTMSVSLAYQKYLKQDETVLSNLTIGGFLDGGQKKESRTSAPSRTDSSSSDLHSVLANNLDPNMVAQSQC